MRSILTFAGLLLALVIVLLIGVKQLKAVSAIAVPTPPGASAEAGGTDLGATAGATAAASATVQEQARNVPRKVAADIANAVQQGADQRAKDAQEVQK